MNFLNSDSTHEALLSLFSSLTREETIEGRKKKLDELLRVLNQRLGSRDKKERRGLIYCYLAHEVNNLAQSRIEGDRDALLRLRKARGVLQQIGLDQSSTEE